MGFSIEFGDKVRVSFPVDNEVLEVLENGNKQRMEYLLLERLRQNRAEIVEKFLEDRDSEKMAVIIFRGNLIEELLDRLRNYEMKFGFAVYVRGSSDFDPHKSSR